MTDTSTATPPAKAATTTPRRTATRPTVSVRPVAVGALNAATIAGATAVAAGGGLVLAGLAGGAALAATAVGARKTGHGKAKRAEGGSSLFRAPTGGGGRSAATPRAGRSSAASPGGRAPGSKPSPKSRTGGAGRPSGGGGRGGAAPTSGDRRKSATKPTGHRRAGSKPGSGSRNPLTADRVAAARRKLANRRQPGPRLSDAIRAASSPTAGGKKPTARDAFRTVRRAVTGDSPKKRGTLRRATAGLIAGGLAAGKAAYDARQRRRKRDAARRAKNDRIARRGPQVGTAVRRPANTTDPRSKQRKAAPAPVPRRTPTGRTPAPVTEGQITMTNPLLAISDDFLAAAHRNQPEGMLQVTAEAHLLPHIMGNLVAAMKIRFERAQEHPLHPDIKEMYGLVHKAQLAVQLAAGDIGRAIEKIHEQELHRLRNPRTGEDMWDVARNRGAAT